MRTLIEEKETMTIRDQQQAAQLRPARAQHPPTLRARRDGAARQLPVVCQNHAVHGERWR
jgi:hypothetical protein